jgi:hypothetical protein
MCVHNACNMISSWMRKYCHRTRWRWCCRNLLCLKHIWECVIGIKTLLDPNFSIWWEPKSSYERSLNTWEFSSIMLPAQGMMYPQRCFRQTVVFCIDNLVLQGKLAENDTMDAGCHYQHNLSSSWRFFIYQQLQFEIVWPWTCLINGYGLMCELILNRPLQCTLVQPQFFFRSTIQTF